MRVLNDLYDYGFKIYQNTNYFKFSIDSILLAEFVKMKNGDRILDMCCGNAAISMILASKNSKVKIDAVEIQKEIYDLAVNSIRYNSLEDQIKLYNSDVKNFNDVEKYDIVVCNPPYFKINSKSYLSKNEVKAIARHEMKLTLEEMIDTAYNFMKPNGEFFMVQRIDRLLETINYLKMKKLGLRKIIMVYTKANADAEFFLLEASKCKKDDLKINKIETYKYKSYKSILEGV